ncbi:MAG: hypothetical protein ACJATI_005538 [Halioglobus sp.]|jgi:hypothetical protein
MLKPFLDKKYSFTDREFLFSLIKKVVMSNPATNCIIKGRKSDWDGLPKKIKVYFIVLLDVVYP